MCNTVYTIGNKKLDIETVVRVIKGEKTNLNGLDSMS